MTSIIEAEPAQPAGHADFGSGDAATTTAEVDARPILRRDAANLWGRAAGERDRLYAAIEAECAARGLQTLVLKSGGEIYPAWVQWECWLQRSGLSERIKVTITIEPQPHHRYELIYRLCIENRGRSPKDRLYGRIDGKSVRALIGILIDGVGVPYLSGLRLRARPLELWLPRNRLVSLRPNLPGLLARAAIFTGIASSLIVEPGGSLIEVARSLRQSLREGLEAISWEFATFLDDVWLVTPALLVGAIVLHTHRRNRISLFLLVAAGVLSLAFQPGLWLIEWWWSIHVVALDLILRLSLDVVGGLGWTGAMLLVASLVGLAILRGRRGRQTYLVYNEGRPLAEPRVLALGDYWHAVLPDIGREAESTRERFLNRIHETAHPELAVWVERVATRGVDGKEEREQVVLSFRRALVFCQFHAYGRDLYVGWDAFLNRGRWAERQLARGIDRKTGERVVINVVEPGRDLMTEYDVVDLNCVIEWAHSRITELVKQIAAEHTIDQEIDFTIQRADRAGLVGAEESQNDKRERGTARLRRAA